MIISSILYKGSLKTRRVNTFVLSYNNEITDPKKERIWIRGSIYFLINWFDRWR